MPGKKHRARGREGNQSGRRNPGAWRSDRLDEWAAKTTDRLAKNILFWMTTGMRLDDAARKVFSTSTAGPKVQKMALAEVKKQKGRVKRGRKNPQGVRWLRSHHGQATTHSAVVAGREIDIMQGRSGSWDIYVDASLVGRQPHTRPLERVKAAAMMSAMVRHNDSGALARRYDGAGDAVKQKGTAIAAGILQEVVPGLPPETAHRLAKFSIDRSLVVALASKLLGGRKASETKAAETQKNPNAHRIYVGRGYDSYERRAYFSVYVDGEIVLSMPTERMANAAAHRLERADDLRAELRRIRKENENLRWNGGGSMQRVDRFLSMEEAIAVGKKHGVGPTAVRDAWAAAGVPPSHKIGGAYLLDILASAIAAAQQQARGRTTASANFEKTHPDDPTVREITYHRRERDRLRAEAKAVAAIPGIGSGSWRVKSIKKRAAEHDAHIKVLRSKLPSATIRSNPSLVWKKTDVHGQYEAAASGKRHHAYIITPAYSFGCNMPGYYSVTLWRSYSDSDTTSIARHVKGLKAAKDAAQAHYDTHGA